MADREVSKIVVICNVHSSDHTMLNEDVFKGVPGLTIDGKRKATPSVSEQEANTKAKLDPYCDLAILYRNTDSYEADFLSTWTPPRKI